MDILLSLKKWIEAGGTRRKWYAGLFVVSFVTTGIYFISTGSSTSGDLIEPDPLYFTGVILKLISVLLLIIGGAVLLRRWQVKGVFQRKDAQLSIKETIRLSPRQAIHLVRVGDQHLLIGATDQTISMLSHIVINETETQPALSDPLRKIENPQVSFNQVLESLADPATFGSVESAASSNLPKAVSE